MKGLSAGLMVGAVLAGTETLAVALTGFNISAGYLACVVAYDLFGGLIAAIIAAGVQRVWRPRRGQESTLLPLAACVLFVYGADKAIMAAVFRAWPIWVGAALLLVAVATFLIVSRVVIPRVAPGTGIPPAWDSSLALFVVLLATGRIVAHTVIHRPVDGAAMGGVALWLVLAAVFLAENRWGRLRRIAGVDHTRILISWTAVAAVGLAFGVARFRVTKPAASSLPRPVQASGRPNVLLISVDTLRADRLSLYGYHRDTTPHLARLARESLVFTHALSPGTWTVPGHAAMLTGRFPGGLGALEFGSTLPPEAITLAERLRNSGYRTGAIVANAVFLDQRFGWAQGFDFYSDERNRRIGYVPSFQLALWCFPQPLARAIAPWRTAEEVNRLALTWLGAEPTTAPFFLFLNYMDTHEPYMPPSDWLDRFPGRRTFLVDPLPAVVRGRRGLRVDEALHYGALYDGAVAYVDDQIHRFLSRLSEAGRLENTLVIVTSDHGEFLGEHGFLHHAVGPYEPVHRVPLLIRYPMASRRGVEDVWVELVDVVPTVLSVVGTPMAELDGDALPRVSHPALIQQAHNWQIERFNRPWARAYTGLYEGAWKLVKFDDGSRLLFDLERDPGEMSDVAGVEAERASAMQMRLNVINEKQGRRLPPSLADPDLLERLGAAGYLQ